MNPSRATLAMTGMLLCVPHACTEQTVVPTEPSRAAPLTSIPGRSSATIRTGVEGERFVQAMATEWSKTGDHRLARFLNDRDKPEVPSAGPAIAAAPSAPRFVIVEGESSGSDDEFPSPSTAPNAVIYYSSTVPFVSGSTGVIVASVTYFGNIATTDVKYSATAENGSTVIAETKVSNRGLGDNAPCMGSWFECSWTFKLQTVVNLSLGQDCGIRFGAGANHRAEWTIPAVSRIPGSTWGATFAANGTTYASNGPCAVPPPTTTASGPTGGDGSSPPYTGGTTTEPPSYQPAPFVPSGHWECRIWYSGTDYEREFCTWYDHNATRLGVSHPTFARVGAADAPESSRLATALPSVFVIVSDQLPDGAMGVIERHKDGPYRNVLLLPSSVVRPAALVAALRALAESRARHGETPAKDLQLTLQGDVLDRQIPAATRAHAASFATLIAGARRADAGAYGTRQILEIRLADR